MGFNLVLLLVLLTTSAFADKKLLLVSVYGPEKIYGGFGEFPQSANLDYVENALPARLAKAGWTLIPPAQTKPLVGVELLQHLLEERQTRT